MNKIDWLNSELSNCFNYNVSEIDAQAEAKHLFEIACQDQSDDVITQLREIALSWKVNLD